MTAPELSTLTSGIPNAPPNCVDPLCASVVKGPSNAVTLKLVIDRYCFFRTDSDTDYLHVYVPDT